MRVVASLFHAFSDVSYSTQGTVDLLLPLCHRLGIIQRIYGHPAFLFFSGNSCVPFRGSCILCYLAFAFSKHSGHFWRPLNASRCPQETHILCSIYHWRRGTLLLMRSPQIPQIIRKSTLPFAIRQYHYLSIRSTIRSGIAATVATPTTMKNIAQPVTGMRPLPGKN